MNAKHIVLLVLAGIVVAAGIFFLMQRGVYAPVDAPSVGQRNSPSDPAPVGTMTCPDGSTIQCAGSTCSPSACPAQPTSPVGCTEEAKICPDGTIVGRTGPNCSFAECPALPMKKPRGDEQVMCTMDAMQCPDGSYVGRTGPKCEFVCPQ